MKLKTTEEFIKRAKSIHGDRYNYSNSIYIGSDKKIKILCLIHGEFSQDAAEHLRGRGCKKCAGRWCNSEEFIEKAKNVHGNKYDYSLVDYKNSTTKVKIVCKEHGVFEQIPSNHTSQKQGCIICSGSAKSNTEDFIKKAKIIHGDKYNYSKVIYNNSKTKVSIICDKHKVFKQIPNQHLIGNGCPKCGGVGRTTKDFINDASEIHNNKYDYSKTIYEKYNKPISIICPIHGEFSQKPLIHIQGSGCQMCSESKGEIKITLFLKKNNVIFERQKIFDNCRNDKTNRHLKFDFYLPDFNLCIEYDGEYHYKSVEYVGGIKNLKEIQKRDKIKNKYCIKNNIGILRIPYFELKNINKIISGYLLKNN